MRRELKLVDQQRGKVKNLDSFGKEWFNTSNRRKGSYRSRHKTMISKSIRCSLKRSLNKILSDQDEITEETVLNDWIKFYKEINEE